MTEDDDDLLPAFTLPPDDAHPGDIAERVMQMPEHRHLAENEITFGWLMRSEPKFKGGRTELGRYGAWTADLADFAATLRESA